ncbi:MAG: MBL fold metallo-hydrolase [Myxococcota bacterium]|nr:MBL fold metallo-hydrolase [Myxococcota bacterium]
MLRRILVSALLAILVVGALAALFRAPLAKRVMRIGLDRNLNADLSAELSDGLHVVLCGAGGPLPDPVRSGPCTAVIAGRTIFVVDAGTGGARNLGPMRVPAGRVEAVFLTHFHSDHIDGLGELALMRWANAARETPLPVFGPTGVAQVVSGFNRAYAADVRYRVAHHGEATMPPGGAGLDARPFRTPAPGESAVVWDRDDVRVTAFRVEHEPVDPAVGYRFDYGGRALLVSGDTKKSENLARFAKGVDLLVHEALATQLVALMNEAATANDRPNLAKITSDIPDYHTTPVEAAEIAREAEVPHLLYTHVVPPLPIPGLETVFLEGVDEVYGGDVTVGRDGTRVSLPRDSQAIEVSP